MCNKDESLPVSVSVNVTDRATADTTFSTGIIAAKSNCSATVSTVAVIILMKDKKNSKDSTFTKRRQTIDLQHFYFHQFDSNYIDKYHWTTSNIYSS